MSEEALREIALAYLQRAQDAEALLVRLIMNPASHEAWERARDLVQGLDRPREVGELRFEDRMPVDPNA